MLPEIEIRLFGTPSFLLNGQPVTGFISSKAPALVYYLAATGRSQMRDLLATLLWTNTPDLDAKRNLRTVLSNLRSLFGPVLEITRTTVTLKREQIALIDSARFAAILKAAEQASPGSIKRSALLAEAVALYQGPLLDGFHIRDAGAFEEWLRSEREHYQRLVVQSLTDLVAYYAHQGEFLAGINYAGLLLNMDPAREETHRQLMLMFALDGQPSAALAQYRTCQQILRQEVGTAPSLETDQLFERIRAGEFNKNTPFTVMPAAPWAALRSAPASAPVRHNLPAQLSAFVGRTAELQQLQRQLQDPTCRLLTITGLGGVGKTRLALATAQAIADAALPFPAGIWFVTLPELPAIDQAESRLANTIAESLQIPLTGNASTAQLIQALHDKELLLVLDNFEAPAIVTPFIITLLQGTDRVTLLVTSRTRLNIRGEQVLRLDGLPAPPAADLLFSNPAMTAAQIVALLNSYAATQLFVQQARTVAAQFTLDRAAATAIIQICQLVQGLPLGIELAATWVRLLSCTEIAAEIAHNLDFLENSLADAPAQQRSLRAVFHYSWHLLSAPEQACLRQLARFRGGFTRAAATKIAGATLPLLAQLVDHSFVRRSAPAPETNVETSPESTPPAHDPGDVRYELPAVIRQFADEQLVQAGEQRVLAARHADYYASLMATQRLNLRGTGQTAALRAIRREIENIRLMWQWSSEHLAAGGLAQLAQSLDPLFHFYDMRSWFQEGATVFAQTAAQVASYLAGTETWADDPATNEDVAAIILWAKLQARHGWFAFHLGRTMESRSLLAESLLHLRRLAIAEAVFNLNYLGAILRHLGEFATAQHYAQEAQTVAQAHNDPLGASIALNILGQLAFLQGNLAEAQVHLRQALAIKRQLGDRWGLTYSLTYLGRVAQATDDYAAAQKLFQESLLIYQSIGDQRGMAFALQNLADTAYAAGELSTAQAHYLDSLRIYQEIGQRAEASLTLAQLGEATCEAGDYGLAAQYLREALVFAWPVQATPGLLAATLGLAALALATGQPAQAVQPLQLVYKHPASNQAQKQKAAQRLATMGVNITGAAVTGADVTEADVTGADVTGADVTGADVTGADNATQLNLVTLELEMYVQAQLGEL